MNSMSQNSEESGRLISVAEFAAAIGKTERQVYRYINQKRIKTVVPEGSGRYGLRIPESEIESFKESVSNDSGSFPKVRAPYVRSKSGEADAGSEEEPLFGSDGSFDTASETAEYAEIGGNGAHHAEPDFKSGGDEVSESDFIGKQFASVPLERHEAAVMRLGYMQSQLEQVQHLLSDGSEKYKEKDAQIEALRSELDEAKKEIIRLETKVEVAEDNRKESQRNAEELRSQLEGARRELERLQNTWWGRLFS
ncbi:helix-turn-helix domain-containing protein [bacterium]|nr:helix-turn-helix domain-containing protein [bacterium]